MKFLRLRETLLKSKHSSRGRGASLKEREKMYEYVLNEDSEYVLCFDNERIVMGKTVAIAFDREDGSLIKHGNADLINQWVEGTRKRYCAAGLPEIAEVLTIIEGPFPLEELNKIISSTDYVGRFYRQNFTSKGEHVDVVV
jgi:hypothetical protein